MPSYMANIYLYKVANEGLIGEMAEVTISPKNPKFLQIAAALFGM